MPLIEANGTRLHYHLAGQGPALVFIHPPLITSAVFRYQIAELTTSFRVLTFDIRGHGASDPSPTPLTYPLIAEDIRQLLNKLGCVWQIKLVGKKRRKKLFSRSASPRVKRMRKWFWSR
ncbi:alpha/beta fold hydrolase [Laceyella sacchari]|uniref:Alpha/beta hydrolase n=1 Tax=Laceyella sacchari TaxID=37482 RepID=A0ABY5U2H6_LACSH|nr:alpha/beta hydrolase [Laceyella sacchari]UWE02462.1 alpha/beta hydrolase [Laceyella sacchari]